MAIAIRKIGFLLFVLLIFCISLFISEKFIRFYNSRIKNICPVYFSMQFYPYYKISSIRGLVYEMQPHVVMVEDVKEGIHTNSLGFRDREYSIPKPKNVFRIVGLGDSICYGLSVKFHDRFLKIIERELNKNLADKDIKYEVIDCGVCGYNLTQYYLNLKNKALKYNPDLIICSLWVDDLDAAYVPAFINNRNLIMHIHSYLIDHSYLWRFLFYKFFVTKRYNYDLAKIKGEENLNSLNKIIELAESNNLRLLFILQSTLGSNYYNSAAYGNYREIKSDLIKKNIPYIEMHPFYSEYVKNVEKLANAPGDSHPDKEGNEIIAQVLFRYLINNSFLSLNTSSGK